VEAVRVSPGGKYLALIESISLDARSGEPLSAPGRRCWIWERKTGRISRVSDDQLGSAGFDWFPEGNRLLIHDDAGGAPGDQPYDGSMGFYSAATRQLNRRYAVKGLILSVPASKGSGVIEVVQAKGGMSSVYLQPLAGRRKFLFQWPGLIASMAQSPDGQRLVFYDLDDYIITDMRGKNARRFKIPGVNENFSAAFSFNTRGTKVAVFTDYSTGEPHVNNTQQLWVADVSSGRARRVAKWDEFFQGSDLAIARALEGWLPDDRSVVVSGELHYGFEKPADDEHDWYRLWAYETSRGKAKGKQLSDSGKGWFGASWWR